MRKTPIENMNENCDFFYGMFLWNVKFYVRNFMQVFVVVSLALNERNIDFRFMVTKANISCVAAFVCFDNCS